MGLFDKLQELSTPKGNIPPVPESNVPPSPADWDKGWEKPTGTLCEICQAPQYDTPGGVCCKNGHGGANSIVVDASNFEGSVLDRLRALGDQKQINPPPPSIVPADVSQPSPEVPSVEGAVCPTCGKAFKHLSRHKCHGTSSPEPTENNFKSPEVLWKEATENNGFILILDALFEKGYSNIILFSDVIVPLAVAVAKENNQPHWGAIDYGKGGPLLAAKLEKWLIQTQPKGVVLADSSTPEVRAVKEVLKKAAMIIIQGVR